MRRSPVHTGLRTFVVAIALAGCGDDDGPAPVDPTPDAGVPAADTGPAPDPDPDAGPADERTCLDHCLTLSELAYTLCEDEPGYSRSAPRGYSRSAPPSRLRE